MTVSPESVASFDEAYAKVRELWHDDPLYQDPDLPEYAYATLVHGNSILRKETDIGKALHLQSSLAVVATRCLPIGATDEEASAKSMMWKDSFPGKDMLPIALQELYFLLETSSRFGSFPQLAEFQTNIFQRIVTYYASHPADIWGDTFYAKVHTLSHTQKVAEITRRRSFRAVNKIAIPPEEKDREVYVEQSLRLDKAAFKTAQYNLLWTYLRVRSILSKHYKLESKQNLEKLLRQNHVAEL